MNWGNKLLIVFAAFGVLIGYLVFRCMRSSVDLVSKDYYKEELAYQEIIDGKNNMAALSAPVSIRHRENKVIICLPPETKNNPLSGTIWLYCAANSAKDRKMVMHTDALGCQETGVPGSGAYVVKLRWKQNGKEYFDEQQLIIP